MKVRLVVRLYLGGVLQHKELLEIEGSALDQLLPRLAGKHAHMMALQPGMVELEFLDEPDLDKRFFRIGTDPSGMKEPMAVDLSKPIDISKWGGI